ncbi:MAG TPA: superoxide dismutase [Blastocatellia bacterium]|nr:superoxide dismutase [Blastocatellia bacterium]
MSGNQSYKARQFDLSGLNGISDKTLEMHFKLYEGYVTSTNTLTEKLSEMQHNDLITKDPRGYSEIKRRLGFEFNGMVLHEYYFGNLKKGGGSDPAKTSALHKAIESSFGTYESWKKEFFAVGNMRGVGWAICYQDPMTGFLSNHWITLHEEGNIAGFNPLVVMDVWEHAFLLDYKPAERPKYIEAFFSNLDWSAVERRLKDVKAEAAAAAGR